MLASPHRLIASRLAPPPVERCPDCGQPAAMRHKGRRLMRCAACSLATQRMRKRAYQVAHRAERQARRRTGGVPCPPYVAWTVHVYSDGVCEMYGQPGRDGNAALVLPDYGACSCGQAGCVHLMVACLARQAEGGSNE